MIKIENVSRKYGDFTAVDNISFSIAPGEIVGLLGHNGAGKTTIMKMLTGYLEPTEGKITINDNDIVSQRQHVQKEIGYLPENCPVYLEMTVIDYLDYAASLQGVSADMRPRLLVDAIKQTALTDKAGQMIATLSRGYRQRTGVAQAILHKPKFLILDEPTNGLDPTQIQQMRELIIGLSKHSTVIISTHVLQEVQAICDRVIIVSNGQVALDSRLDNLQSNNKLMVSLGVKTLPSETVFEKVVGVKSVNKIDGTASDQDACCYAIDLSDTANREETAAAVAKKVHDEGLPLYSLHYETRNLEAVFAQMSTQ